MVDWKQLPSICILKKDAIFVALYNTEDSDFETGKKRKGDSYAPENYISYEVQNVGKGVLACVFAGMMSSMTGVGGGAIKVPVMNLIIHIPMKAASSTSSYIIGITAFYGAITYFFSGHLDLPFAGAVAIGAFIGALAGTYLAKKMNNNHLRRYFSVVLFLMSALALLRVGGIL